MRTLEFLGRADPGKLTIETPVGIVGAELHKNGAVTIDDVPSYRLEKAVTANVSGYGDVTGDIAWGGNWFFLVNDHPFEIEPAAIGELTGFTTAVKNALAASGITGTDGAEIDHIEIFSAAETADSRTSSCARAANTTGVRAGREQAQRPRACSRTGGAERRRDLGPGKRAWKPVRSIGQGGRRSDHSLDPRHRTYRLKGGTYHRPGRSVRIRHSRIILMIYDVAIVGSGIVGAACADRLSAEGLSVCVINGWGKFPPATAAGMGHIVAMDDSEAQFALTSYSQRIWDELSEELPAEAEFGRCGTLWIAADDEEMAEAERKRAFYNERGVAAEMLDEKALREAEPGLRECLPGALLVPGDSVIYQPCAAAFLLQRAVSNGADLLARAIVRSLKEHTVELWDFAEGPVNADTIVVAAGCSSADLVPSLRTRPRKGHLVITGRTNAKVHHQLVELGYLKSAHGTDDDSVAFNIQPRSTGQLLIGSSRQYGSEDDSVDFDIVSRMMKRAIEYFPAAADAYATRIWTGFRPATPDGLPYIGRVPGYKNVFAATGHEGLGITTSLGTAALIADEILGRDSAIPRGPYSPARNDV